MKSPNQFELAHAAETLRRLRGYLISHLMRATYDYYLLDGAADTIDEFIENENLTFFKEIPDGNTETELEKTSTPTPDREIETGDCPHYYKW